MELDRKRYLAEDEDYKKEHNEQTEKIALMKFECDYKDKKRRSI